MPTAVVCPNCRANFEVASDLAADAPIRCRECVHTFLRSDASSAGIQAGPAPLTVTPIEDDDEPAQPSRPPRRPIPPPVFPLASLLWIAIGILFLLLVVSVGFNAWVLVGGPDRRHGFEEMRAEKDAAVAREMAEVAAENARQQQMQAQLKLEELRKQQDELARQLKQTEEQLEEARRQLKKEPEEVGLPIKWGTLEGRVVWKGALPKMESLEGKIRAHADGDVVRKAPKDLLLAPTFRIDPKTRGVANVVVFFKFTDANRLPIHADDKVRKDPIVVDAPFLVYEPHMVAVYPEWFDGTNRGQTGQKFIIRNFSPVPQAHRLISPKNQYYRNWRAEAEYEIKLTPERHPIIVNDSIHSWMQAYVWVFDHPYFAITKDDGSFTIPRVPGGVEVQVMAWHEYQGWLFTRDGKTLKLADEKNVLDFEMGAPDVK